MANLTCAFVGLLAPTGSLRNRQRRRRVAVRVGPRRRSDRRLVGGNAHGCEAISEDFNR